MSAPVPYQTTAPGTAAGNQSGGRTRIILHYPDITLKGRNQKDFQDALYRCIRSRMDRAGWRWKICASRGRAIVVIPESQQADAAQAAKVLQKMPGIFSLVIADWLNPREYLVTGPGIDWTPIGKVIVDMARRHYKKDACFAVRVHRADKSLPLTSTELECRLGDMIISHTEWRMVRLNNPDRTFHVDVLTDGMYFYTEKLKAVGGLPVGTSGRVLALLSGGIDSPVAAYQMAKRGCNVDFFHLSASHMRTEDIAESVVGRLAARLSEYTQLSRLYVVPNTYFDLAMSGLNTGFEVVLLRRFMLRAAEQLARKLHAGALVNGDSLGQVASQTLENLASVSSVAAIPVLRPLIGSNKDEIISQARQLGTYEISIEPYKDCCALISRHPKTRSNSDRLSQIEAAHITDYTATLDRTCADMVCLEYRNGTLSEV